MHIRSIAKPIEFGREQIPGSPDRRAGFRVQTVMRVGHVITDRDEGLVLIKNLSDQGARLWIGITVRHGDVLTLALAGGRAMTVRVIWTEGRECGVRFTQDINCADLLLRLPCSAEHRSSRPLRLNVSKPAVIRSEAGLLLATVEDVSHAGMKIRHDGSLAKGMAVRVTLPSGLARSGVVRWSRDIIAGILLLEPFRTEDLASSNAL